MCPKGYQFVDYKYWECEKCGLKFNVIGTDYPEPED